MSKILHGIAGALVALGAAGTGLALAVHAGHIYTGADQPHPPIVSKLLEWARERSIMRESEGITPPANLAEPERARRGAGNYAAMCAGCHLAAGQKTSELRTALYPQPPNLAQAGKSSAIADPSRLAARQFWIIKYGIAASGMPAWSKSGMEDEAIWDLVAFLHVLPTLSTEKYRQIVAASDGHSHRGANTPHPPAAATRTRGKPDPHPNSHSHDKHSH